MRLLQLLLVLAPLVLPFLLHLTLDLLSQLVELLLSVLADYLLPVGVLILDRLLFSVDLLLPPLVLLRQGLLGLQLRLFLLLIEALPLLTDRIAHILLDLALSVTDSLLRFAKCLIFGVLELVVIPGRGGPFTLPVAPQTHLAVVLEPLSGPLQVVLLLLAKLL